MLSFICVVLSLGSLFSSCKKNKTTDPENAERVQSISDNTFFTHRFVYDDQKRISRIDYDAAASLRFSYNASGIVFQRYNGETADPDKKFDITLVNGRAVSGRQYNGNKLNEYNFQYNADNRLSASEVVLKVNNVIAERHYYTFHYNGEGNFSETRHKRVAGITPQDSVSIALTYYAGKNHLSWQDMGADFFGTTTVCVDNLGYGTPMPQLFDVILRPRGQAPKTTTFRSFTWNAGLTSWVALGPPGTSTHNEDRYGYDDKGRLTNEGSLKIVWE